MSAAWLHGVSLVIGAALLCLTIWRYYHCPFTSRPVYKWCGASFASQLLFMAATLLWGGQVGAANATTLAALGALLAPAWSAAAFAHSLCTRRGGTPREPLFLPVASVGLLVAYVTAT